MNLSMNQVYFLTSPSNGVILAYFFLPPELDRLVDPPESLRRRCRYLPLLRSPRLLWSSGLSSGSSGSLGSFGSFGPGGSFGPPEPPVSFLLGLDANELSPDGGPPGPPGGPEPPPPGLLPPDPPEL